MVIIGCPSKTLIQGGYSILNPLNMGISLALDNKFYCQIHTTSEISDICVIDVNSFQIQQKWSYIETNNSIVQQDNQHKNVFLEACLVIFYDFLNKQKKSNTFSKIQLDLFFEDGFYTGVQEHKNNKFTQIYPQKITKTGIGSSSCVTVVVVASLLYVFGFLKDFINDEEFYLINMLSQHSNNLAQNKIGSGFDISTCVFGSQIFKRPTNQLNTEYSLVDTCFPQKLDCKSIISQLKPVLLDFQFGSDTRILVGQVQKYLNENEMKRQQFYDESNSFAQQILNCQDPKQLQIISKNYRLLLKNLGIQAQVEIEPDVVSFILDTIMQSFQDDVYYAVAPGAGGYDAACLLVSKDFDVKKYYIFQLILIIQNSIFVV